MIFNRLYERTERPVVLIVTLRKHSVNMLY